MNNSSGVNRELAETGTGGWTCPYCGRPVTITPPDHSEVCHFFGRDKEQRMLGVWTQVVICPNQDCREYTITGGLHLVVDNVSAIVYRRSVTDRSPVPMVTPAKCQQEFSRQAHKVLEPEPILKWSMRPASFAKQFPEYVPKPIIEDYEEACLIRDLSPKASATLSRRCLQTIIRNSFDIKKGRLIDEINAIQDEVDPQIWKAIDAVRRIGNIGAHMEKDINLVVEVDPTEAQRLIQLIEMLIEDWYVKKRDNEEKLRALTETADAKDEARAPENRASHTNSAVTTTAPPESGC